MTTTNNVKSAFAFWNTQTAAPATKEALPQGKPAIKPMQPSAKMQALQSKIQVQPSKPQPKIDLKPVEIIKPRPQPKIDLKPVEIVKPEIKQPDSSADDLFFAAYANSPLEDGNCSDPAFQEAYLFPASVYIQSRLQDPSSFPQVTALLRENCKKINAAVEKRLSDLIRTKNPFKLSDGEIALQIRDLKAASTIDEKGSAKEQKAYDMYDRLLKTPARFIDISMLGLLQLQQQMN